MPLTFFLDEQIDAALAPQLRAQGIDAHNVYDLRQQGWADAALLQSSAADGRVVVTHNIRDFIALHRTYLARIIHDGSSRNRWAAWQDQRTEPWGPDAYSCSTLRVRGTSPLAGGSS